MTTTYTPAPRIRCATCRQPSGHHKMSCPIGRGWNAHTLPRRNPGLSLRRPDRAHWPKPH